MGVFHPDKGIDEYLSDNQSLSPFVPPLCFREALTGTLRPRNFAMLLFGRNLQGHIHGAFSLFSVHPGVDRSEPHAERHELAGTLIDQARRLIELLDVQSYVAFDKTNRSAPNAVKYPPQALHEAMINALAHRDYEIVEPTRITVFSDRIEVLSPGSTRDPRIDPLLPRSDIPASAKADLADAQGENRHPLVPPGLPKIAVHRRPMIIAREDDRRARLRKMPGNR